MPQKVILLQFATFFGLSFQFGRFGKDLIGRSQTILNDFPKSSLADFSNVFNFTAILSQLASFEILFCFGQSLMFLDSADYIGAENAQGIQAAIIMIYAMVSECVQYLTVVRG
jgi:hypothetical protein